MKCISAILLTGVLAVGFGHCANAAGEETIKLTITGGHITDPQDHGRPVILIGNALGVKPEVFREAFSHVKPAPAGEQPKTEQVRRNKAALMGALAKYGVTNERLDEVSNYYRYRPESGRLWRTSPATAAATIKDGKIISIHITKAGSGYSSAPNVSVPGHPEIKLQAKLSFGSDLKTNGSVVSISTVGNSTKN